MAAYLDETGLAELWSKINERVDINELLPKTAAAHNSVCRGKDITYKFTNGSLFTDISSGTFDDIFVGDYFNVSVKGVTGAISDSNVTVSDKAAASTKFYIAHLDKDLNKGDTTFTAHHAVIIPATDLGTAPMNATNTTAGG